MIKPKYDINEASLDWLSDEFKFLEQRIVNRMLVTVCCPKRMQVEPLLVVINRPATIKTPPTDVVECIGRRWIKEGVSLLANEELLRAEPTSD